MHISPGRRVKIWREANDLTPSDFSERTGIKYSTLKSMEDDGQPSHDSYAKLRTAFPDLSIDWIISGEGEMRRPAAASLPPDVAAAYSDAVIARAESQMYQEQAQSAQRMVTALRSEVDRLRKSGGSPDQPAGLLPISPRVPGFRPAHLRMMLQQAPR